MRNERGSGERTWSVLYAWQFVLNKKGFSFNMNYHELNMNYSSYLLYHCPVRFLCLFYGFCLPHITSIPNLEYWIYQIDAVLIKVYHLFVLKSCHHWRKSCTSLLFSKCGRYFEKYELPMKKCGRLFEKYARPMKKCERLFEKYARPGITFSRELNMKECLVHH